MGNQIKIYIWGTRELAKLCFKNVFPEIEVLGFVESVPTKNKFLGKKIISGEQVCKEKYDYIILANSHEDEIINSYTLNVEKIIFYRLEIYDEDKVICKRRTNPQIAKNILMSENKLNIIEMSRAIMPCVSMEIEGLKFLFDAKDNLIANEMIGYDEVYSKDEMEFFNSVPPRKDKGYFIEIGANVGTTSIYFKNKLNKSLKYIAFEPLKINCKYLKMNCIINDCEDIVVENYGLSNTNDNKNMYLFDGAYGSSMVSDKQGISENCSFRTLDSYIKEKDISPKDIAYIWADVQCHELEVIEGAFETLKESEANLFIEFNVGVYRKENKIERFIEKMMQLYKSFICYEQYENGNKQVRDIKELVNLPDEMGDIMFCNLLLMK